ncbi:alpha-L-rhamnosidase C-terminal domain-containing protein, partial [Nonomuraea sp. NPDC004297]
AARRPWPRRPAPARSTAPPRGRRPAPTLGAVADFLHRTVAGLAPAAPGYRRLRVAPRPGGGLTSASASLDTPYGRAAVSWTRTDADLTVTVTVPPGASAEIDLPYAGAVPAEAGPGTHTFTGPYRSPRGELTGG